MAAATKRETNVAECYCDGEKIVLDMKEKGKVAGQERQEVLVAREGRCRSYIAHKWDDGEP